MKAIDLSIVIVSFNTKKLLDKCITTVLKSLVNTHIQYELIVVDNGSTDGTIELISKKFPLLKIIKNKTNLGFGRANNQGDDAASGKVILFLNSDIEVSSRGIEKLYDFFITLPLNSIAGGKLFNLDKSPQPSCGPRYSLINIFIALFLKGDYLNITRYSPYNVKEVDWVMGACMMITKDSFNRIGGFDEGIFMYMDEIDFQHRAKKRGFKIFFNPEAHFLHAGAGSSHGRTTPILNVFRGLIYFYKKNHNYLQNVILRVLLVSKSLIAIALFSITNNKSDRNLYIEALKLSISY